MKKTKKYPSALDPADVKASLALIHNPDLSTLPRAEFAAGWQAVLRLFPGLHPDETFDRGGVIAYSREEGLPGEFAPFHTGSGWPVALDNVADEAWLRYDRDALSDEEYYGARHANI